MIWFCIVFAFGTFFFWNRYFVTGDGPAHLYNGTLIFELLAGDNPAAQNYLEFNPVVVPNWTGHLLLGFFNLFLPAALAEKVFLLLYFVGFCYSFRYLVTAFNPSAGFFSILILPFAVSQFVHAGFYNFCVAFVFLFFALGLYARHKQRFKWKHAAALCALLLLVYFSHLTVAVFAVMMLLALVALNALVPNGEKFSIRLKHAAKHGFIILGCCIPLVVLVLYYLAAHKPGDALDYLQTAELFRMIRDMTPLVGHGPLEHSATYVYLSVIALLAVCALVAAVRKKGLIRVKAEDAFLVAALFLITGYFILPDSDHNGGFISVRILFIFFLVLLARLVMIAYPRWVKVTSVVAVLLAFSWQLHIRGGGQRGMSQWAARVMEAGEKIEPDSVVLPVNCGVNWLSQHLSNYLGAEKPLMVLENYEAHHVYFPLRYKKNMPVTPPRSVHPDAICADYFQRFHTMPVLPDYLLFYGFFEIPMPAGCEISDTAVYLERYQQVYRDDFYALYLLRN